MLWGICVEVKKFVCKGRFQIFSINKFKKILIIIVLK